MKYEWKKQEKHIYLPKNKPELITIPEFKFFTIEGEGNPNNESFGEYVGVLYSLSYAIKMSPKKGNAPSDYFEYTVYPLEGIWDINETAKNRNNWKFSKDELVFKLMIRQPDFVSDEFASKIIQETQKKKPHELLNMVQFERIKDGKCVQMLHIGSYDNEPESFRQMNDFAGSINKKRKSMIHREIYLSDVRRVAPEKLKTILRFQVE